MSQRSTLDAALTTLTSTSAPALDSALSALVTALANYGTQVDLCVGNVAGCAIGADAAAQLGALKQVATAHVVNLLAPLVPQLVPIKTPTMPTSIASAATTTANAVRGGYSMA